MVQSIAYVNSETLSPAESVREVIFQLDDGDGNENGGDNLSDEYKVLVDVKGNQAPEVVAPIPDWNITVNDINRSEIDGIRLGDAFEDPDDDDTSLTYTINFLDENDNVLPADLSPDWMVMTPNATLIAMPGADDAGEEFTVRITAEDPGGESAETTFTINVSGLADNAPELLEPTDTFTVSENDASGGVLYTVGATDPDPGDEASLTYSITGGTGASRFQIDSGTGDITLMDGQSLDFENDPKVLELNVRVSDSSGLEGTGLLTVFVQDANDPPTAIQIPDQIVKVSDYADGWFFDVSNQFVDEDNDRLIYRAEINGERDISSITGGRLSFIESSAMFIGIPAASDVGSTYTIDLFATDVDSDGNPINGEVIQTFDIIITASLDHELRDALYYLDDAELAEEEYDLPEEGENVEVHEVFMYAQTPAAESGPVEVDMLEALALLDGGFDNADVENDQHRIRSDDVA